MDHNRIEKGKWPMQEDGKIKRKRNRKFPNRKWTEDENVSLLSFLSNNSPFEKPTSQVYYRRFLAETGIATQWYIVRSKVRNMRVSYNKANVLKSSNGANIFPEETILRICPYYEELDGIFGSKGHNSKEVFNTSEDTGIYTDSSSLTSRTAISEPDVHHDLLEIKMENSETEKNSQNETKQNSNDRLESLDLRLDHEALYRERESNIFENHGNIKAWDYGLKQQHFHFERERGLKLLELKEMEIKSREKLKILELEMQERIALKEIEMKEKIALKELECKML